MLNRDTKIFVTIFPPGAPQQWLVSSQTIRDKNTGTLILWPTWNTDPSRARSMTLEYATIFRVRYQREQGHLSHFTLAAGDRTFVEESGASSSIGEDQRAPMQYKGLLARPGVNVRTGERCFFVKLRDQTGELEPVRGATPEEAVDLTFDRGLQDKAERAPVVQPAQPVVQQQAGSRYRVRPGSLPR
ncbi:MAG: hypothetical protein WA542_19000 [Candidatus Acidiferrum sp.]